MTGLAQNEGNIWFVGYIGIDFNTSSPSFFKNNDLNFMTSNASICDSTGNLLFHTDGQTVWNKQHRSMPHGRNLSGLFSQKIIVPRPGADIYYLFAANTGWQDTTKNGLRCYTVDMREDSGLGDITDSVTIFKNCSGSISAVHHANGKDIWIAAGESGSNTIKAYLITESGISNVPIVNFIDNDLNNALAPEQKLMKFSPDGKKIAQTILPDSWVISNGFNKMKIQIGDFNNTTGQIANIKEIVFNERRGQFQQSITGIEFSQYGNQFYFAGGYGYGGSFCCVGLSSNLYQVNTDFSRPYAIVASYNSGDFGLLQMANDGKIYVEMEGIPESPYPGHPIGVINCPSSVGENCNFQVTNPPAYNGRPYYRNTFPLFVQSYFDFKKPFLDMPNVFTPNGDGKNDGFWPLKFGNMNKVNLKIINRWGQLIFETENLKDGWCGGEHPAGTYYWTIDYTGEGCIQGNQKGWVQIIR